MQADNKEGEDARIYDGIDWVTRLRVEAAGCVVTVSWSMNEADEDLINTCWENVKNSVVATGRCLGSELLLYLVVPE
jgi:hypothetical protein